MKTTYFSIALFLLCLSVNCQSLVRDTSFGSSGVVNTVYDNNSIDMASEIIILPDHKFIVYGIGKLYRFNENGTLDTTFGVQGVFYPQMGLIVNVKLINGNLYIIGSYSNSGGILKASYDGIIDSTFGEGGIIDHYINEHEIFYDINITSEGNIIAAGIKQTYPWQKLFVVKFDQNGILDASFQGIGYKEVYVFPVKTELVLNISPIENGSFYIPCVGRNDSYIIPQLAMVKMDTDGNLDTTFGSNGVSVMAELADYFIKAKYYNGQMYLLSYNSRTFVNRINLPDVSLHVVASDAIISDYMIHDDLSVSTLGMTIPANPSFPDRNILIKKFMPNGDLDPSFSNTGIYEFNLGNSNNFQTDDISRSFVMSDDKILICGESRIPEPDSPFNYKCTLSRFNQVPLSTASIDSSKPAVFPNPVENILNISTTGISFPAKIKLYNLLGQAVGQTILQDYTSESSLAFHAENLKSGCYIIEIIDVNNSQSKIKFLKK